MKNLHELDQYRVRIYEYDMGDHGNGAFQINLKSVTLFIIASNGHDWEHISVSTPHRCPTWEEMCYVKDLFFDADEVVFQLHPAKSDYINNHKYCLHMWKPLKENIPLPPSWMVGAKK